LRKTAYERGSLGRANPHLATRGGREAAPIRTGGPDNHIAGIYSKDLNVLGLIPHPENLIDSLVGGTDGRGLFESLAAFCEQNAQILAG
jgi:phosphoribosylformylglycinamidine (FGAM) synthase-like amidotransferase family enzyme